MNLLRINNILNNILNNISYTLKRNQSGSPSITQKYFDWNLKITFLVLPKFREFFGAEGANRKALFSQKFKEFFGAVGANRKSL